MNVSFKQSNRKEAHSNIWKSGLIVRDFFGERWNIKKAERLDFNFSKYVCVRKKEEICS